MQQGWIKLHRSVWDHDLWRDKPFSKGQAWIDLIMMMNYEDRNALIGNQVVEVKRGSKITSIRQLCERWGWSNTKVKAFLNMLENDGMAQVKSDTKKTVITLMNYSVYQHSEIEKTTEKHHESDEETSQKHTNKKLRNKEIKNIDDGEIGFSKTLEERFVTLRGKGLFLSPPDYQAIDQVIESGISLPNALKWLDECFVQFKPKSPGDSISSFKYCAKYILDKHFREQNKPEPMKTPDIDPELIKIREMKERARKCQQST